jgi:hypothetical protein
MDNILYTRRSLVKRERTMCRRQLYALGVSVVVLACSNATRIPVDGARRVVPRNPSWTATLESARSTGSVEKIIGSAAMRPGAGGNGMVLSVRIANATPGSSYTWQVRRGRCGADEGQFVPPGTHDRLDVGADGRGESAAMVSGNTPVGGRYFVTVFALAEEPAVLVACGEMTTAES